MTDTKASNTARLIAGATLLLAREGCGEDLVAPGAEKLCRQLLSGSFTDRLLARSVEFPVTRRLWWLVERLTLPGIVSHYWRRKRWIEVRCRAAIAAGYERVVVAGAGYDTLGFRLAREFGNLEVLELDHPATQNAKLRALKKAGVDLPPGLRFTPLDLVKDELPAECFNERRTVLILEGLLMYLTEAQVGALFARIGAIPAGEIMVIFSFMSRWPDGGTGFRPKSRLIESWLKWCKEPFLWAMEPEKIGEFVDSRGFSLHEVAVTRELGGGSRGAELDGENLAVCEKVPAGPVPRNFCR